MWDLKKNDFLVDNETWLFQNIFAEPTADSNGVDIHLFCNKCNP